MSINSVDTKTSPSVNSIAQQTEKAGKLTSGKADEGFRTALELQFRDIEKGVQPHKVAMPATLKFSNHAVDRMTQRGISFTPDQMTKIENAARKATEKGAKETLIFSDDSALIVSLKNNTVVTVMDKASMKENVFTNIDSTVIL